MPKHFNYEEMLSKEILTDLYITDNLTLNEISEKTKITRRTLERMISKYGIHKSRQASCESAKRYNLEHYGTEHPMQSKEILDKAKATNLAKYGVEHPLQSQDIKNKVKATTLNKYGVENVFQSDDVKDKIRATNIEKYGTARAIDNPEIKKKAQETIKERYGSINLFSSEIIKEKIQNTIKEKYGVDYMCLSDVCQSAGSVRYSKPNVEFAKLLTENGIDFEQEYKINKKSYDFKVNNILIEINPTITHNATISFKESIAITKNYHKDKSELAIKNNFKCIHIFDWDDKHKIINLLSDKSMVYARECEVKELDIDTCADFINAYHLQGMCKGQTIRLGLYHNDELVEVMTFGKPRYNKKYQYELLRLCSKNDKVVVGGSKKIFKYMINKYQPKSIISYCDNSKFSGDVYLLLGFTEIRKGSPSKHWYNIKTKQHITDNLLRARGYDQLFNTSYGKGKSNTELMIENGFVEVYDCGQATYEWKNE